MRSRTVTRLIKPVSQVKNIRVSRLYWGSDIIRPIESFELSNATVISLVDM